METAQRLILIVGIGLAFMASAAFAADIKFSGFFGNPSAYDLLKPGPKGGAKLRWLKNGVDNRTAELEQRFSKWGSADDAFKLWSEMVVKFIDNSRGVKREPKK